MKKNILYLFAASLAFVSCSQDNDLNTTADNADREIRFASSLDITTRANTADATTVQTNGFKAAAFNYTKSGATKTLGDAFVTNWAVAYSNGAWVPGETKLWPSIETNKGLDFLAYSTPQDITNKVSYSKGVMTIADFTPAATAADQKELLVAYTPDQTFENTKSTGVSLAFKHALSQIAIQVKNSKSKAVTISEVKVCNAAGKGTLKYGYEQALTWAQGTDKASYNLSDLSVAVPVYAAATDITNVHTAGDYFMLVPQTAAVLTGEPSATSGAYFSITYKTAGATNSTTVTTALPANGGSGNYEWEAGKKYLYTLELSDILTATLTSMEQINALWSDFGGGLTGQQQENGSWIQN